MDFCLKISFFKAELCVRERERESRDFVVYEDDRSFVYWSTAADGGGGESVLSSLFVMRKRTDLSV